MKPVIRLRTFCQREPRKRGEGLRIGTSRRPPRGVRKADWDEYFDVWFPILAPSANLRQRYRRSHTMTFDACCAAYEREMLRSSETRQAVELLAALALRMAISVGCNCESDDRCHRSRLRMLIERAARELTRRSR